MSKNYVIIGGDSGIGLATTNRILQDGSEAIVVSRNKKETLPDNTSYFSIDVTEDEPDFSFLPEVIDGIVYAPGSINLKPFHRAKISDFLSDFNLNVLGAVRVIQAALPSLKRSEKPSIVLFSTVAVSQGMPFHSITGTVKSAVEGLARSLAAELAPKIRVNVVAPSVTDTPMAKRLLSTPEKKEASANRHPLQLVGEPKDVAETVIFLLSDKSRWITGQVFHVDGGMSSLSV